MNGNFKLRVMRDRLGKNGERYETMETILSVPGDPGETQLTNALRIIRDRIATQGFVELVWEGRTTIT